MARHWLRARMVGAMTARGGPFVRSAVTYRADHRSQNMATRRTVTALAVAAAAIATGFASAAPAAAGGIIVIASPSHDNTCANQGHATQRGATTSGSGSTGGILAALPVSGPLNHCGGADLPRTHPFHLHGHSFW